MTNEPKTLGETIFLARKSLGLSQAALGKKIGRTGVAICNWESDRCGPSEDVVPRLAKILGLSAEELIKRSRAYKSRTPRTGTQILLLSTARCLTDSKITLSLDQAQALLKIIRGQIQALENSVAPRAPRKSRSKKPKHP